MIRDQIPALSPVILVMALAVIMAVLSVTFTACADPEATPAGGDTPSPSVQEYAACWGDTARAGGASPPVAVFARSTDASLIRCRHLEPGADYWIDHYITGGRFPVPRYRYSVAEHEECLATTAAWFKDTHPEAWDAQPDLFAETVCAVPPPVYTNVPED